MATLFQIIGIVTGGIGGVTALFGETHRKGAKRPLDRLTKVGWIAALSLLIAGFATVGHTIIAAAENAEQQRRLEGLLEEIANNANAEKLLRESESTALQDKQEEIDTLRSEIQRLREPRLIYSKTFSLPKDGILNLDMVPTLKKGDKVNFRVFDGSAIQAIRKKIKLPFGPSKTMKIGTKTLVFDPQNLVLATSSQTYAFKKETGDFLVAQDSSASKLTFKLPLPSDTSTLRTKIRALPRVELKITRASAE